MSADQSTDQAPTEESTENDIKDVEAQRDVLLEENRRLRAEYARAKQAQYRRTAIGLVLVGAIAALAGYLFPVARTVLFVLAGIGAFSGVLTLFLTPERFITADVGEQVYTPLAGNEATMVADLGLSDDRVYTPVDGGTRLYVPQQEGVDVPEDALDELFVVTDDEDTRGIALEPSGEQLFAEFERALRGDLETDPDPLVDQLASALVDQFELVDSVGTELGEGQVTVELVGAAYGDLTRFDQPVISLIAVGLARGLDTPIRTEIDADAEPPIVVYRWAVAE